MKKTTKNLRILLGIIIILAIVLSIYPKTYADVQPTLENIARVFLNCKTVNEYNQYNDTMNLYVTTSKSDPEKDFADILTVHVQENYVSTANLEYRLDDNILTGEFSGSTDTAETAKIRAYWPIVTNILIDCIEQFHGGADGEMFDTLSSSEIANYRVDKEGLQIINNSPNYYSVQIDISKVVPTLDDNTIIKVKDLEDVKENLSGDGIAKLKKGNILFYKCTIDDKDIISIGEQGEFSYKINKSIYSILEVMLGSTEAVNYYKENYPTVQSNKQFEGFKIEVNPVKNSTEGSVFGVDDTYKFVRITIDREAINTALKNASDNSEKGNSSVVSDSEKSNNEQSGTSNGGTTSTSASAATTNNGSLPKTGKDNNVVLVSLYAILILAWGGVMVISAKIKKKNN